MTIRRFAPLIGFLMIVAILGVGLLHDPRDIPSPLIGKSIPDFVVPSLQTEGVSAKLFSSADMRGRPWVLNVFASWCTPCLDEHPVLMQWARSEVMLGVALIGLSYKDKPEAGRMWLRRHGDPFQSTASDPNGRTGLALGVYAVPETFVVDAKGVVRYRHAGPLTQEILREKLNPLIEAIKREAQS